MRKQYEQLGSYVCTIDVLQCLIDKVMTASNGRSRAGFLREHVSSQKGLVFTPHTHAKEWLDHYIQQSANGSKKPRAKADGDMKIRPPRRN